MQFFPGFIGFLQSQMASGGKHGRADHHAGVGKFDPGYLTQGIGVVSLIMQDLSIHQIGGGAQLLLCLCHGKIPEDLVVFPVPDLGLLPAAQQVADVTQIMVVGIFEKWRCAGEFVDIDAVQNLSSLFVFAKLPEGNGAVDLQQLPVGAVKIPVQLALRFLQHGPRIACLVQLCQRLLQQLGRSQGDKASHKKPDEQINQIDSQKGNIFKA